MAVGLGLGELAAIGEMTATGFAVRAWGVAAVPQAASNRVNTTPAHFMPVEWDRY